MSAIIWCKEEKQKKRRRKLKNEERREKRLLFVCIKFCELHMYAYIANEYVNGDLENWSAIHMKKASQMCLKCRNEKDFVFIKET